MENIKYLNKIIFLMLILFLLKQSFLYAQSPQVIQVSLGKHIIEEDKIVSIPLYIKSDSQITALQLILSFDISAIILTDIKPVEAVENKAIFQAIDQGMGKVAVLLISTEGLSVRGPLLHLDFKALGSDGEGSVLAIENVKAFKNGSGNKISVEVSNGYLLIANPASVNLLYPLCLGLALLGAAVLATVGVKVLYSKKKVKSLCPSCGSLLQIELSYCPNCKQVFRKKCNNCGAIVPITNIKCPYCDQNLDDISYAHKPFISARLDIISGKEKGKGYILKEPIITIGRSRKNQLVLKDDLQVSAHHAQIIRQGDHFVILDLKSTNGTFVNRMRVTQHVLQDGDEVAIGNSKFTFHQ
jgi:hypothetical protein